MNGSSVEMLGVLVNVAADVLTVLDTISETLTLVMPGLALALALASDDDRPLGGGGGFMEENVCKVDCAPYITVEVQ